MVKRNEATWNEERPLAFCSMLCLYYSGLFKAISDQLTPSNFVNVGELSPWSNCHRSTKKRLARASRSNLTTGLIKVASF